MIFFLNFSLNYPELSKHKIRLIFLLRLTSNSEYKNRLPVLILLRFYFFMVVVFEPRAFYKMGKHSSTELHPQP